MINELLEKFEDVFKPIDDKERSKRFFPLFVDEIHNWEGLKLTEDEARGIAFLLAMNDDLRDGFFKEVEEMKRDFEKGMEETHPDDIDDEDLRADR